ncbi:MAG TPA: NAD(P)-binding protein [Candidatus Bathyarchaeia archaeon]|nr:NAD(P)-binding protein [Candidatus Bathyarchaeia archaeon]
MTDGRAVVIGGSIAGLCAARALADHFSCVTVVDRDADPGGALDRAGVPQGRHVHTLLARGSRELERFFPGFERTMLDRGALELDFGTEFATLRQAGWDPRLRGGIPTLFASRALLESIVRELLRKVPNVELVERTSVSRLLTSARGANGAGGSSSGTAAGSVAVSGVELCPLAGGSTRELAAGLVVDASGRASKSPEWLRALGVETPAETTVDSFAGYSTRWFEAPPPERWPSAWWWKAVWVDIDLDHPEASFAGVLFPVEERRWIVTLAGVGGHYPPSDEAGFMAALAGLRSPILAETVRLGRPISRVYSNRSMANRWRHYESWREPPAGFIALGDAACAFNPVYGQGMTTSVISARVLAGCLESTRDSADVPAGSAEFARRFFRAQGKVLGDVWSMAVGADFRLATTEGVRPFGLSLTSRYMDALLAACGSDTELRTCVSKVINLLEPPAALFAPWVLGRVAWRSIRELAARRGGGAKRAIPPMPPPELRAIVDEPDARPDAA